MLLTFLLILTLISNKYLSHGYIEIEKKVVNGIVSSDIIPYQASIRVSIRDYARFGRGHTCGGVLISSRTVLTAAHCLMDGDSYRTVFDIHVVLGSLNRYKFTQESKIEHVERIIVHPQYRRYESFADDIGILILRRHVKFNENTYSISMIDYEIGENTSCEVSGWGANEWRGEMPSELYKGYVRIVSRADCNFSYADIITNGMVCANGVNQNGIVDVCQGDSGGPLVCDGKLVGLASFGFQCGLSALHPGVFTDVFYYRDWIMENWNSAADMQKHYTTLTFVMMLFMNLIWL